MKYLIEIDGQDRDIIIPNRAADIPFGDWCDFTALEAEWMQAVRDGDIDDTESDGLLYGAVASICGDAVHDLPMTLSGDSLTHLFASAYTVDLEHELTVLRLYCHLYTVTAEYRAKEYAPETVPAVLKIDTRSGSFHVVRDQAARLLVSQPLTTSEAIEAQEFHRQHELRLKELAGGVPRGAEAAANLNFTLGLTEVALLLRQEGERIPTGEAEREAWLDRRRALIATVDLATVMEVRSFCIAACLLFGQRGSTNSSSTDRRVRGSRPAYRQKRVKGRKKQPAGGKRRRAKPGR